MYSLRNILLQEPVSISGAVVVLLNTAIIVFGLHLTAIQVGAINAAVVAVLNLFYVRPMVASKAGLRNLVAEGKTAARAQTRSRKKGK